MATIKPRTTAKRPTSSRSIRVAKKKHGVTKKQAFILIAALAIIGVVAIVASRASTSDYVYVGAPKKLSDTQTVPSVRRISSDGASTIDYQLKWPQALFGGSVLSRDKTKILVPGGGETNLYNSATGALIKQMPKNISDILSLSAVQNGRVITFMPGDRAVLVSTIDNNGKSFNLKIVDLYSSAVKTLPTPKGYMWFGQQNISRDGKKVAYVALSQAENRYVIITANIDGSGAKVVRKTDGNLGRPQWANDNKKLSYYESNERSSQAKISVKLKVVNADGTGDKTLTNVITNHQRPGSGDRNYYDVRQYTETSNAYVSTYHDQWSTGSSSLIFKRITPGHVENLFTIDINTGKISPVTSNKTPNTVIGYYGVTANNRIVYSYGSLGSSTSRLYEKQTNVVSVKFDGTGRRMLYTGTSPIAGLLWW